LIVLFRSKLFFNQSLVTGWDQGLGPVTGTDPGVVVVVVVGVAAVVVVVVVVIGAVVVTVLVVGVVVVVVEEQEHSAHALMGEVIPPLTHLPAAQLQTALAMAPVAVARTRSAAAAITVRYLFIRPPC